MEEKNQTEPDPTPEKNPKPEKDTKPESGSASKSEGIGSPDRRKQLILIGVIAGGVLLGGAGGGLLLGPMINAARAAKSVAPAEEEKGAKTEKAAKEEGGKSAEEKEEKQKEKEQEKKEKGKKEKKEKKKHSGKEEKGEGSVFKIENLIVNPAGTEGSRFLMATVAFELDDPKAEETLRSSEIAIRDKIISVLENQTMEMLTRPGARDSLRNRLAEAVSPFADDAEMRVYLPQFVIQ